MKEAFGASSGPALPMVIAKVTFEPTVAVDGAVFVTNMSDDCAYATVAKRKEINTNARRIMFVEQ